MFAQVKHAVVAIVAIPKRVLDAQPATPPWQEYRIAGTGFIVDPRGILVTAKHVMDPFTPYMSPADPDSIPEVGPDHWIPCVLYHARVPNPDGTEGWEFALGMISDMKTIAVKNVGTADISILTFNLPPRPPGFQARELATVVFAEHYCEEGDEVFTCGFPLGERLHADLDPRRTTTIPSFSQGIVSATFPYAGVSSCGRH